MVKKIAFMLGVVAFYVLVLVSDLFAGTSSYAKIADDIHPQASVVGSIAVVETTGSIVGIVTDQEDRPLGGISVSVDQNAPGTSQGFTQTNSSGAYQVDTILPGTYRVLFSDVTNHYVIKAVFDVIVTPNAASTVNVKLDRTSHITGIVTDKDGSPLVGVKVVTHVPIPQSNSWYAMPDVFTDALGRYDAAGLGPNTYRVRFSAQSYAFEFYDNVDHIDDATSLNLGIDTTIANINAQLADAGHITGAVTDMAGTPLQNIAVSLYRRKSEAFVQHFEVHGTDASGRYQFDGLPAGAYRVYFSGGNGQFFPEYYTNSPTLDSATDVIVSVGMTVTNISAQLFAPGAFTSCQAIGGLPVAECEALTALYNSTNGPNWLNKTGWLSTNTPCGWHAVRCTGGHVAALYLYQNQLVGSFPTNLGDLPYLEEIHFGNNQLTGILPQSLAQLVQLRKLRAEGNQLTGQIPTLLGQLSNLEEIVLGGNQLEGAIPVNLGSLSKLTQLELGSNLSGEIPAAIGNLPNLKVLNLGGNKLSGAIPATFGNLLHLEQLWLYDNQLQGNLPSSLGQLSSLTVLHIAGNQLADVIPPELANLANLEELYLDRNQFSGSIPTMLGNLTKLRHLALWDNQLTGAIPATLGNLVNLESIYLSNNQLTGEIPTALGNLAHLTTIHLGNNQLTGDLPASLGNLANLHDFRVSDNKITGVLPNWITNFKNLEFLYLHSNQLTGTIPANFGQLTNLKVLDLSNNKLSGTIPGELGNLTALTIFRLWNNRLTGSLPAALGNLRQLEEFHVGGNQLSGDFPQFVLNFTHLRQLELWGNRLPGEFPVALANLPQLEWLDLGGIGLTGAIPKELGQLSKLVFLSLSWNDLAGVIPPELGALNNLEYLLLQGDQLIGPIPTSFANLLNLRELWLNENQLTGTIPAGLGQLVNLEQLDLANNQLEGDLLFEFGNLTNLTRLAVNLNRLRGPVPSELGNLTKLERLYIQDNQLSGSLPAQLSALTELINFHFYHNDLCEPTDAAVQSWLESIPYLESTGLPCGATPAHIAGVVTDGAGNKLPNIAVTLQRNTKGDGWNLWRAVAGTTTDANGAYHFGGLGHVGYTLYFADPAGQYGAEYHNNAGALASAATVTATLGATITVNATLDAPVPPAITVATTSGNLTTDTKTGEVTIAMPRPNKSDLMITRTATCPDNAAPSQVELLFTVGDNSKSYLMSATATAQHYQATIPQADLTTNGTLAVKVTCGSATSTTAVGQIQLYDPSGRITAAATGLPIANATVTLYTVPGWLPKQNTTDTRADTCQSHHSKAPATTWNQPAPTTLGVLVNPDLGTISPAVNRMLTNADGRYGWDVAQGCWYVVVTAPGYQTLVSPVVGVPPAVTDLDLSLVKSLIPNGDPQRVYLPLVEK